MKIEFESINDTLSIFGLIGLITAIIRTVWVFFTANVQWVNNIRIREIADDEHIYYAENGDCISPVIYTVDQEYATTLSFLPNNMIFKKMKLYEIKYRSDDCKEEKVLEKTFKNVSPQNPLIIKIEMAETIPRYMLAWKDEYGIKARYDFCMNGRDGNYNISGIVYTIGKWSKIRKILGLK